MFELSLQNYANVYRLLCESNGNLKSEHRQVLKAFRELQWRLGKETGRVKTVERIEKEYKIFEELVVKDKHLMRFTKVPQNP